MNEEIVTTPPEGVVDESGNNGRKVVFSASVRKEVADRFRTKVKNEGRKVSWVIDQLMELYLNDETPINITE